MTDYLNIYKTPIMAVFATGIIVVATHYFGCPFSGGCPFSSKKKNNSNITEVSASLPDGANNDS